jgi:hypothetical protein
LSSGYVERLYGIERLENIGDGGSSKKYAIRLVNDKDDFDLNAPSQAPTKTAIDSNRNDPVCCPGRIPVQLSGGTKCSAPRGSRCIGIVHNGSSSRSAQKLSDIIVLKFRNPPGLFVSGCRHCTLVVAEIAITSMSTFILTITSRFEYFLPLLFDCNSANTISGG